MDVLGLIPARSGSTGVPGKNVRALGGKPLIAHTIDAARMSSLDRVIVSTDSADYATTARNAGAETPFLRPGEISGNEARAIDVVTHCLEWLKQSENTVPDAVFYLQPTSPFRSSANIDEAIDLLRDDIDSVVSVCPATEHPYYMFTRTADGNLTPLIDVSPRPERRQDLPEVLALNDTIMLSRTAWLNNAAASGGLIVNLDCFAALTIDSVAALDINDEEDFVRAEMLVSRQSNPV